MRTLVLGAVSIGGYFGGRFDQAGTDVSFLVRPARAARLKAGGLVIASPLGDAKLVVETVLAAEAPVDLVIVSYKAYDLPGAIKAIRPAVGPHTIVLPLLNGLAHPDALDEVADAAETLFATSLDLVSIGFNKPRASPALWFYIYDRDIAAARAYAPDWKSPRNVALGCSAFQFGIYSSTKRPQTMNPDELKANPIAAFKTMQLANENDIPFVDHMRLPLRQCRL